jgi:hypothetical protein
MVARLGRNRESHVFAVFLMAAALSGPAQPKHTLAGWFGGPQAETCAAWLANPSAEGVWIAGYWSGINLALKRQVGKQTDFGGIMDEIEKECRSAPSEPVLDAIAVTYEKMAAAGR